MNTDENPFLEHEPLKRTSKSLWELDPYEPNSVAQMVKIQAMLWDLKKQLNRIELKLNED